MKKKIVALGCALLMMISFTACTTTNQSTEQSTAKTSELPMEISQADWNDHRQTVKLDTGITMAYVEMGVEDGDPMVLIHGMTDNSRSWSLIAPYFAKAGYHIYMIDLRGHGASDKPDTGMYAISDYAADIANFMDKMGIEKADIVGHSLGSMVSQALLLNFPEKCKSVTLVSSTTVGNGVLGTDYYEYGISLGADGHPDNEFMDAWYYCSAPVDPEFLQYEMAESQALPGYVWECVAGGITFSDMRPFYSFIDTSIPVLIAWGDQDSFFNEDIQKELRANLPQAEFVSYAGIGHNIQWENTEQLANDILNFLGK